MHYAKLVYKKGQRDRLTDTDKYSEVMGFKHGPNKSKRKISAIWCFNVTTNNRSLPMPCRNQTLCTSYKKNPCPDDQH